MCGEQANQALKTRPCPHVRSADLLGFPHPHDSHEVSCPVTEDTQVLSLPQEGVTLALHQVLPGDSGGGVYYLRSIVYCLLTSTVLFLL